MQKERVDTEPCMHHEQPIRVQLCTSVSSCEMATFQFVKIVPNIISKYHQSEAGKDDRHAQG